MPVQRDRETGEELAAGEYAAAPGHVTPEQWVANREVGERFQECIDGLPEDQRAAFREYQVKRRPAQRVAEEMGISRNVVHLLVLKAKQNLRRCLERSGIGPDDLPKY